MRKQDTIQIPEGYQQTKIGVLPKYWKVKLLDEIMLSATLGGNYENHESNNGIPVIKMGNINRGNISVEKVQNLPLGHKYSKKDILQKDDLLFNTRNTLDLVGKVAIWKDELPIALYNSNLLKLEFDRGWVFSNSFMNYFFNSESALNQLKGFATGTTSVAAIYARDLKHLKIPLPPLLEQKEIADCLSLWDDAIEKLQTLIEQKELLKKGLMQQLLSGKKRLKGFEEEWGEYFLNEMFKERREMNKLDLTLLSIGEKGVYPQSESNKKDTSNIDKSKYKRICKNDIGYNTMRMWQGRSAFSNLEGIVSPAYTIVTPKSQANPLYFAYLFKTPRLMNLFWRKSQGLVNDTLNCKFKDFSLVKTDIPCLKEQTEIAEILSTTDKEIDLQKQRLQQLKDQKKGLMQQLLTGKKRLNFSLETVD